MRPMTWLAVLVLLTVGAVGPRPAAAQTAKAERAAKAHYLKGAKLFTAKQYDGALAEYRAAYELAPRPALLFNIARALHEKGDKREALAHYRRYLAEAPAGAVAAEAREYAAALERELAPADVPVAAPPPAAAPPAGTPSPAAATPERAEPPPAAPAAALLPAPARPEPSPPEVVATAGGVAPDRGPLRAGLLAGLSVASVSWEDWNGGARLGLAAGAFGSYAPVPWFALRAELLYVQKGAGYDDNNYNADWHTDFLEGMLLGQVWYWHANLALGAYAGKRMSADTPFDDHLKDADVGLVVGAGLAVPLGPGAATLDLRYEHGLSSLKIDADAYNRAFLITVGYSLR